MLVIILESVGVPGTGIALILGVDRILDMVRTVTNVTGDVTVSVIVATQEGELTLPDGSGDGMAPVDISISQSPTDMPV